MTPAPARPVVACDGALIGAAMADPVLAAEAERGRLADQLHAGLLQSLVVVRHAVAREQQPRAAAAAPGLPTADEALADCLAETRRLVWHLRPRTLDAGIDRALDALAQRLADDGRCLLRVDVLDGDELSAPQAAAVYRVVQAVCLASSSGAPLAVAVAPGAIGFVVRVSGYDDSMEADGEVSEWARRAATYDVAVEMVRS